MDCPIGEARGTSTEKERKIVSEEKQAQEAAAEPTKSSNVNRAKMYQLVLFPMNNGATNVYYVLLMNYIAYYANGVLGLILAFATTMVTVTRALDAFIDPIVGSFIDRTETKIGKFRPFMLGGNVIMIVSSLLLFYGTRLIPESMMAVRYVMYTVFYILLMVGYSVQTSCTRSGQTCLTNDPNQRPMFTLFNTVASLLGMGVTMAVGSIVGGNVGYGTTAFFNFLIPLVIFLSLALTILAVIGIAGKDRPEFWGLGESKEEKKKLSMKDYGEILKGNKELQRLMVAASGTKFAFAVATNTTVGVLLYSCMMGNYNGLYLPMYVLGYVFSVPFFLSGVKISQKHGQKRTLTTFTTIALAMYVGVVVLLSMWSPDGGVNLSIFTTEGGFKITLNLYTVLFIVLYGLGYGAYYATADMAIPMVADCSDYEMYRTGNYAPGIIGSLFSLVDKLVSSLSTTVVGLAITLVGLSDLPDTTTEYLPGMKWLTIVLFCVIPMIAWVLTLWSMKGYSLTGPRMKEIQAINACRKDAIAEGTPREAALEKYQTVDDLPDSYKPEVA